MVRYYILPNADHLREDELKFELELHAIEIKDDAKIEDIKRALRHAYKADRREPKSYESGLNIAKEIEEIEPVVRELRKKLREQFEYTIISRFRHYLIRLASAEASNEEEVAMKEDSCKLIEEILRAYKQRVTYDPEHSNDETDLDLGEGAKALKESWRNPDPKATAKGKKEDSKNTGAKPKVKQNTEKKESKSDKHSRKQNKEESSESDSNTTDKKRSPKIKQNTEKRESKSEKHLKTQNKEESSDSDSNTTDKKHTPKKNNRFKESHKHKHEQYSYAKQEKKKHDRKKHSYYSTTDYTETSEGSFTEDEQKRRKHKIHNKSRGRFSSTSSSESSSEQEEQTRPRPGRNRERNNNRSQTPVRRYREDYYRSARSRVENWDITFSGDSRSIQVEDFLNRVRKLAKHEKVGKNELLDRIHYKLKGEASDWWFTRESHCTTWKKFESEIRFRFGNPNRDRGIRSQLRELRQKRGETFVAFVTEVEKLNLCLKHPHSSRTIFEIVWENMRPHYRSKLATTRVHNLEHLLDLNHRIDANDPSLYRSGHNVRNEMHNLEAQSNSDDEFSSPEEVAVNALQRKTKLLKDAQKPNPSDNTQTSQTADFSTVKCWNCQKTGHHWRSCKEPKLIFCYACGNIGRTTRTCERNHPQSNPNMNHQSSQNSQQQSLN